MKVLIIQPWIRLGGAEMVSVNLAHALQEQGHQVAIACTYLDQRGMPPKAKRLTYLLPASRISRLAQDSRFFFLLFGPWILLRLVWKHAVDFDLLNAHEFPTSWIAAVVGSLRRIPIVWSSYGPPCAPQARNALTIGLGDWLGWMVASSWIDRLMVRGVDAIHVPSERSRKQIRRRYKRDASVIPLGVDSGFYGRRNGRGDLSPANHRRPVLLCVGKLHPQENQIICLLALKRLLEVKPDASLILAGDGPMMKSLQATALELGIEKCVHFLGHVSAWRVRALYAACDIHLYPPFNESWGLTPFEALCADVISVVSSESGAAELITREKIGVVCDPTPAAFADTAIRMLGLPEVRKRMAERGRRFVSRTLTWGHYSKAFLELAGSLMGSR